MVCFFCAVLLPTATAQELEQLAIEPEDGSQNPVQLGQLVTLQVNGLADPSAAQAGIWPPEQIELWPMFGDSAPEGIRWQSWGKHPMLLVRAHAPGRYLVQVKAGTELVDYEVVVEGEPPPEPSFRVEPVEHFHSKGKQGGPFEPRVKTYTIMALNAPAEWTATTESEWLVVTPASGTLAPGESAGVDVMVTSAAEVLPAGNYSVPVQFRSGGKLLERDVLLSVGQPEPDPDPDPIPGELWSVVIEETSQRTPQQAQLYASPEARALFGSGRFLVKDKDVVDASTGETPDRLEWYIERAEKHGFPTLFVVQGPNESGKMHVHYEGDLPDSISEYVKLVEKYKDSENIPKPSPRPPAEPKMSWRKVCDPATGRCRFEPIYTAP